MAKSQKGFDLYIFYKIPKKLSTGKTRQYFSAISWRKKANQKISQDIAASMSWFGLMQSKELNFLCDSIYLPAIIYQIFVSKSQIHPKQANFIFKFTEKYSACPVLLYQCPNFFVTDQTVFTFWKSLFASKKNQRQIFLPSFEPKNEQNYFLNSALATKMSKIKKNEGTLLY